MSMRLEGDDWSELDANGVMVGLNAFEVTHGASGGGAVLTLQPQGSQNPRGRIATFKDSEGSVLQLFEPPVEYDRAAAMNCAVNALTPMKAVMTQFVRRELGWASSSSFRLAGRAHRTS